MTSANDPRAAWPRNLVTTIHYVRTKKPHQSAEITIITAATTMASRCLCSRSSTLREQRLQLATGFEVYNFALSVSSRSHYQRTQLYVAAHTFATNTYSIVSAGQIIRAIFCAALKSTRLRTLHQGRTKPFDRKYGLLEEA